MPIGFGILVILIAPLRSALVFDQDEGLSPPVRLPLSFSYAPPRPRPFPLSS